MPKFLEQLGIINGAGSAFSVYSMAVQLFTVVSNLNTTRTATGNIRMKEEK
jgi:hypothetical protein